MDILILQGSPRLDGNTQAVLDFVIAEAEKNGARTETIQLSKLKDLTGCQECHTCQKHTDRPGCVIEDDMQAILDKTLKADLLLWATPVFCLSPTWLLKMAMDRFYCMSKFDDTGNYECLLAGKKMATVVTAGGGDNEGAEVVTEIYRRIAEFCRAQWLGEFVAGKVQTPETIRADKDLIERAKAFGRKLAS
jgi:multimeric flavodoxin WrbA